MCLLYLFFFSAHFKFILSSAHVQGAKNSIADAISCTQIVAKTLSNGSPRASGYPYTLKGACARKEVRLEIPALEGELQCY